MAVYRKILMAYDGSEASINALDQAASLVLASEGAELTIINVMQVPEVGIEMAGVNEVMGLLEEAAEDLASEAAGQAQRAGIKACTVLRRGTPYIEISELAEQEGSDLIVTGRRGISRLERALMGSVTSRVIAHTQRDVMVFPRGSQLGYGSVAVATDGSKNAQSAVRKAIDFALDYNSSSLTVVSVLDVNTELMALRPDAAEEMARRHEQELESALACTEGSGLETGKSIVTGPVPEGIVKAADAIGAGILFMGTHGRTGMSRLFMGSVAEKVIGCSHAPVLVTRGSGASGSK